MKKADVGISADDGFAIEFQQHTKHAVRRRVLRTHVQGHAPAVLLSFSFYVSGAGFERCGRRFEIGIAHLNTRPGTLLILITVTMPMDGEILAERMSFPVVGHHDPRQVGVIPEAHAEQVERFALVPVCAGPDRSYGIDLRIIAVQPAFKAQALAAAFH